jgi:hypothetical protein
MTGHLLGAAGAVEAVAAVQVNNLCLQYRDLYSKNHILKGVIGIVFLLSLSRCNFNLRKQTYQVAVFCLLIRMLLCFFI